MMLLICSFAVKVWGDQPLFPAPFKTGKYGYIDGNGTVVISAAYSEAHAFSERLAVVNTGTFNNGTYGYIDISGKVRGDPKWSWIGDFRCGRAWVYDRKSHLAGFIDEKGALVVPCRYKSANTFEAGIALVAVVKPLAKPLAASVDTAALESLGVVRWTYIDRQGVELGMRGFSVDGYGTPGQLAPLQSEGMSSQVGYVNMTGAWAIPPRYDRARPFRNGLALVSVKGQQGFIDNSGKWRIGPKDWSCGDFSEKRAVISEVDSETGKTEWGLIDCDGQTILPASDRYVDLQGMSEGLAVVGMPIGGDVKYGYLDINGVVTIEPQYDSAGAFRSGLALVGIGDEFMYIARDGRVVWRD